MADDELDHHPSICQCGSCADAVEEAFDLMEGLLSDRSTCLHWFTQLTMVFVYANGLMAEDMGLPTKAQATMLDYLSANGKGVHKRLVEVLEDTGNLSTDPDDVMEVPPGQALH